MTTTTPSLTIPSDVNRSGAVIPRLLTLDMIRLYYLPLSKRTIQRMISAGVFPAADVSRGSKIRLWKKETIDAWIDSQTA
jgi:excisionase family DNA binding protein